MKPWLLLALVGLITPATVAGQGPHAHHHGHTDATPTTTIAPVAHTPLGDRIASARAGDTIRLPAGIHRGPIVVDRRVVLLGEAGTVIDADGTGTVVTLAADSAELLGVLVRNGGASLDRDDAGVKLVKCHACRVEGIEVSGTLHGIYVLESRDVVLERNRIRGDVSREEARRGNGIHLFNSVGTRVAGNHITATRDGIYFSFASRSEVANNDVTGVRYGLHYMYSDDNRFVRNRFTRNAAGAAIMFSKRIRFEDNVFAEHIGSRAYGILLQTSDDIVALRNRIEGNLVGLFLDNATRNLFRENLIVGNGTGIDFIPSAESNTFTDNVITGNRTAVRKAIGGGENAFSLGGRGNYWGDRGVFDLDGDGIGDRPYRAADPFASLAAARPVLEVFAITPAARALSWAERAFPVFDLPSAEDPHPLVAPPSALTTSDAADARTSSPRQAKLGLALVPFALLAALGGRIRRARQLRRGLRGSRAETSHMRSSRR